MSKIAEAIHFLKNVKGHYTEIEPIGKNRYLVAHKYDFLPKSEMTAREIIKEAKIYSSENPQNTAIKTIVKHYGKRKDRRATRDLIIKEDFDNIPTNSRVSDSDIWDWD
jgi:hypothetical protein